MAPTPTGYLHLGHARTFSIAAQRCAAARGTLRVRIDDLDPQRSKPEYVDAFWEDLEWMGLQWGGEVLYQSQRMDAYLEAWRHLKESEWIYPCTRSRKDVRAASQAPHAEDEDAEPIYPVEWRPDRRAAEAYQVPDGVNWRFRVPYDAPAAHSLIRDGRCGRIQYAPGEEYGDFVVWRRDGVPAYELAVVIDDLAMGITEVVRGEDLLKSTVRQNWIYRALHQEPPCYWHTELVRDTEGRRLAKRDKAMGCRELRSQGISFAEALAGIPSL